MFETIKDGKPKIDAYDTNGTSQKTQMEILNSKTFTLDTLQGQMCIYLLDSHSIFQVVQLLLQLVKVVVESQL